MRQIISNNPFLTLVNASGAKSGGAREILRRYLLFISDESQCSSRRYVVFCPNASEFSGCGHHIKFIDFSTSGVTTLLFSTIFIGFYSWLKKADKIVSFNNLNLFVSASSRVTYFHQEKAVLGKGARFFLIRWNLRFQKHQCIVVQTSRIKNLLIEKMGGCEKNIKVRWPGVRRIVSIDKSYALCKLRDKVGESVFEVLASSKVALLPVYDAGSEHKDFEYWKSVRNDLSKSGYVSVSLCPEGSDIADVNLGVVVPEVMEHLYSISDVMVLISKQETLCLPAFEFAQTGKPIIALEAPYILNFIKAFPGFLGNVHVVSKKGGEESFKQALNNNESLSISVESVEDIRKGQWDDL